MRILLLSPITNNKFPKRTHDSDAHRGDSYHGTRPVVWAVLSVQPSSGFRGLFLVKETSDRKTGYSDWIQTKVKQTHPHGPFFFFCQLSHLCTQISGEDTPPLWFDNKKTLLTTDWTDARSPAVEDPARAAKGCRFKKTRRYEAK